MIYIGFLNEIKRLRSFILKNHEKILYSYLNNFKINMLKYPTLGINKRERFVFCNY